LSDEVNDAAIATILNEHTDSAVAVEKLVEAALSHGGRDNVTAILIDAPVITAPAKKIIVISTIVAATAAAVALAAVLIHFFG